MLLSMEMLQIQAMECSVCLQLIGYSEVSAAELALAGTSSRYAMCPCCGQGVKPKWSMAYMRRHDAWTKKLKAEGANQV